MAGDLAGVLNNGLTCASHDAAVAVTAMRWWFGVGTSAGRMRSVHE